MRAYQKSMNDGTVITAYIGDGFGTVAVYNSESDSERVIARLNGNDVLRQASRLYGDGFEEVTDSRRTSSRNPYDSRTFKTARRKLTMQEKIALINEDMTDPDDPMNILK